MYATRTRLRALLKALIAAAQEQELYALGTQAKIE